MCALACIEFENKTTVNCHAQIHLRQFDETKFSARDISDCEHNADQLTAETCVDELPTAAAAAAATSV